MEGPKNIVRLVAAVLLLGLFMTVHVAKALHTHTGASTFTKLADGKETIQSSKDCATCDYHFTKDSSSEIISFELVEPTAYQQLFFFYKSYLFASIGLHYSDRGPPAFA